MKAISPMIAVVLLIAFTVAVGGILSTWLSTLATTQTSTISSGTEKQVRCAASALKVSEVRYPTGTSRGAGVNVTVVYDSGTETLSNITVEVTARGVTDIANSTGTVVPGEARVISITGNYPVEVVSARGLCRDNVPVIATCKSGETCMRGSN